MMENKDYYQTMGVKHDASAKEIKTAYRRLARKFHPDLNKDADSEKKFKALGEAYDVLKDAKKRQRYDQMRAGGQQRQNTGPGQQQYTWSNMGGGAEAPEGFEADFFDSIFGARARSHAPRRGADLYGKLTISLQEAFDGVTKEIILPDAMGQGNQKLKVKIPAGVKSEQQIRLKGLGEPGAQGASKGDLYITVLISRDPLFDVIDNDVYLTLPITPWEAALGATVKVPTLAGKVDLKIPAHSQGGQTLRLKKRGLSGSVPGDQLVLLKIVIPQPTTATETELYQQMAKDMAFNPREHLEERHG